MAARDFCQAVIEGLITRGHDLDAISVATGIGRRKLNNVAAEKSALTEKQLDAIAMHTRLSPGQLAATSADAEYKALMDVYAKCYFSLMAADAKDAQRLKSRPPRRHAVAS